MSASLIAVLDVDNYTTFGIRMLKCTDSGYLKLNQKARAIDWSSNDTKFPVSSLQSCIGCVYPGISKLYFVARNSLYTIALLNNATFETDQEKDLATLRWCTWQGLNPRP